ncbi:MAG: alpha-ketoacid dehydrogenase subunit beta, partial [Nitrospinota bacterium]
MGVVTYIEAISQALREEMERDPDVFLLGEDIGFYGGAFKVTKGFFEHFGPERVIDTPISEALIVGASVGAALMGMRPVAEMQFADFISCGFDQVVNQAATIHYRWGAAVPMVIRLPSGGGVHGGPFHSQNPEAWFVHTPGLKVVAPATAYDAKGLLKAAIRDDNPVLYLENKYLYRRIKEEIPEEDFTVPLGRGAVRREGEELSIITYGSMVHRALEAAETLEGEGRSIEVVDLRSLKPLDKGLILESVKKTSKAIVLHEDHLLCGVGAEVASILAEEAFDYLDGPIVRIAAPDTPVPYSPPLEEAYIPQLPLILEKARELL